jgi:RNA polymerase sigma factor (sigma-70 family)
MSQTDLQLLECYTRERQEDAFAEIVRRHIDLVYSAALRQVRCPQLAEEVAQSVFTDLALNANRLAQGTVLTAWLYQVTRRTAIDVVRKESRRQLREQTATEINAMNATLSRHNETTADAANDWTHIEPLLDEAMHALDETDRTAVLLRYFENKSLREVGATLGTSDGAAQKRVSRAVERLREFFTKRGLTIGASGLGVLISANAVQAAPTALAVTIATAAGLTGTTIAAGASITATKAIAMTTLHKTIIGATLITAVGAGIYETRQASAFRDKAQTLQQQQAALLEQIGQAEKEREEAQSQVAALKDENEQLRIVAEDVPRLRSEVARLRVAEQAAMKSKPTGNLSPGDPFSQAVLSLSEKAALLGQRVQHMPDRSIPEFQFLSENDWLTAAKDADLDSDAGIRKALSKLRSIAKNKFGHLASGALDKYVRENNGQLPADLSQLKPHFETPVDDSVLSRYEMLQAGKANDLSRDTWVISEKAPVDREYDSHLYVGLNGRSGSWGTGPQSTGDPDPDWYKR